MAAYQEWLLALFGANIMPNESVDKLQVSIPHVKKSVNVILFDTLLERNLKYDVN